MRATVFIAILALLVAAAAPAERSAARGATRDEKAATVNIRDLAYRPAELTVKKGTKVTWTNNDDQDHTVVAEDGKAFDSGVIKPGKKWSFTFEKAGTFKYRCKLHPRMKGTIKVE